MKLRRVLLVLTAGMTSVSVTAQSPPPDWRLLTGADWQINAERVALPMIEAEADFNGDGKTDRAVVLVHKTDPNRAGIFVYTAGENQTSLPKKVDEYQFSSGEFMLLAVQKGCYRSEATTVCLSNSGLLLSEIEFGWGTLYWKESETWKRIHVTRGEFEGL